MSFSLIRIPKADRKRPSNARYGRHNAGKLPREPLGLRVIGGEAAAVAGSAPSEGYQRRRELGRAARKYRGCRRHGILHR